MIRRASQTVLKLSNAKLPASSFHSVFMKQRAIQCWFLGIENQSCLTGRFFSSEKGEKLKLLSDVEEYVQKEFVLEDLQKKFDEENLPAPITTGLLLEKCKTVEDVLTEIKNAVLAGKLWKEEINLYLNALLKMRSEIFHSPSLDHSLDYKNGEIMKTNLENLHDNPYFQFLIKEALTHSPVLTTNQLISLFRGFVYLRVPAMSNSMLLLIAVLQNRINDFFPKDVLKCFMFIKTLRCEGVSHINALRQGLIMHLENQTADEPSFKKILKATTVSDRISLLLHMGHRASFQLQLSIFLSVVDTIRSRPRRELRDIREAENILKVLGKGRMPGKFMLSSVINYFLDNGHEVTERHKALMTEAKAVLDLEQIDIPPHLLLETGQELQSIMDKVPY